MLIPLTWLSAHVRSAALQDPTLGALEHQLAGLGLPLEQAEQRRGDTILDIEVTPNRAHALSLRGLSDDLVASGQAQRVIAAGHSSLERPRQQVQLRALEAGASDPPRILSRDPHAQARGGAVSGLRAWVSGDTQSPESWTTRLAQLGWPSRGLIPDLAALLTLELGVPLSAHRLEATRGSLRLKWGQGEAHTSEGKALTLGPEDLVTWVGDQAIDLSGCAELICSAADGSPAEVEKASEQWALVATWVDPVLTRLSRTRAGVSSERSLRLERGADPSDQALEQALREAARVLGAECPPLNTSRSGEAPIPLDLSYSPEWTRRFLGADISTPRQRDILTRIGCVVQVVSVDNSGEHWRVKVPGRRPDLDRQAALAGEVLRIDGYEQLGSRLPQVTPHPDSGASSPAAQASREREVLRHQLAADLQEIVSYGFVSPADEARLRLSSSGLTLRNPLAGRSVMRSSLLVGLEQAALRLTSGQAAFELGTAWPGGTEVHELGLTLRGSGQRAQDFAQLKGLLEALADVRGDQVQVRPLSSVPSPLPAQSFHPGVCGTVIWNGQACGIIGALHPEVQREPVMVAQLRLPLPIREWAFKPPYTTPVSWRDLSVIAPSSVQAGDIEDALRRSAGPMLVAAELRDRYQGPPIPSGQASTTYRLSFQTAQTLSTEQVSQQMLAITAACAQRGWTVRDH